VGFGFCLYYELIYAAVFPLGVHEGARGNCWGSNPHGDANKEHV
jgi:hypothetical protein